MRGNLNYLIIKNKTFSCDPLITISEYKNNLQPLVSYGKRDRFIENSECLLGYKVRHVHKVSKINPSFKLHNPFSGETRLMASGSIHNIVSLQFKKLI